MRRLRCDAPWSTVVPPTLRFQRGLAGTDMLYSTKHFRPLQVKKRLRVTQQFNQVPVCLDTVLSVQLGGSLKKRPSHFSTGPQWHLTPTHGEHTRILRGTRLPNREAREGHALSVHQRQTRVPVRDVRPCIKIQDQDSAGADDLFPHRPISPETPGNRPSQDTRNSTARGLGRHGALQCSPCLNMTLLPGRGCSPEAGRPGTNRDRGRIMSFSQLVPPSPALLVQQPRNLVRAGLATPDRGPFGNSSTAARMVITNRSQSRARWRC